MTLAGRGFLLLRPLLHSLDAETAHGLTLRLLGHVSNKASGAGYPSLAESAFGLKFPNPLGLAAGFDKNAEVPDAMLSLGFGFVETGTVTPRPQSGNPPPRLFRLAEDRAVINCLGFNNGGHAAALHRLRCRRGERGIVGVNIGANSDSVDRIADYVAGIETFSEIADYLTVNISSPNTPGLRSLQSRAELTALLSRLNDARSRQPRHPPMLLKIAPDLDDGELEDVARCCADAAIDGIIVSNTTTSRPGLKSPLASEPGGLSGQPLFDLSTRQLARMYLLTNGGIPLIGVGGISNAETAWTKIAAGATLLQLYTALIYQGPALVAQILSGLTARLAAENTSLGRLRGRDAALIAHQGLSGT